MLAGPTPLNSLSISIYLKFTRHEAEIIAGLALCFVDKGGAETFFWASRIRLRQNYLCVVEELKSGWQRAISNSSLLFGWNDIGDGRRSGAKRDPETTQSFVPHVSEHLMLVLRVEMVDGVEPFAHGHTLDKLRLNLVTIERQAQGSANNQVKGRGCGPAWKNSLSGETSEPAFLDIDKIGHRE